jgi:hypothetical protein
MLALGLSMALAPGGARGDDVVARVEQLLAAGVEASDAYSTILALADEGERALIALFEREQSSRYVRLRALGALTLFESERSTRYLERLVRAAFAAESWLGELHPARSPLVLRRALDGLRTNPRLAAAPIALEPVALCLGHADAHVRRAASELLAELASPVADPRVERVLYQQLAGERSRMVRASLARAITSRSVALRAPRSSVPKSDSPPR